MPHILSPQITQNSKPMWAEPFAYTQSSLHKIQPGKLPPVNYDQHTLNPHSLTHLETPAHTQKEGRRLGSYYEADLKHFYGKVVVIKLSGNNYRPVSSDIYHWEIQPEEIKSRLLTLGISGDLEKILISTEFYPQNEDGYHDPNYVLTLSQAAADFLISWPSFNLYGTSWKSSDFKPGASERPIHNTLFTKGLILENLDLKRVPEGVYFLSGFPLPISDASESPVVPVLFTKEELEFILN